MSQQYTKDLLTPDGVTAVALLSIADQAITYAKIQDVSANSVLTRASSSSGVVGETSLSASQLLGRGSTGNIAPIAVGTGLSFSGATLNSEVDLNYVIAMAVSL